MISQKYRYRMEGFFSGTILFCFSLQFVSLNKFFTIVPFSQSTSSTKTVPLNSLPSYEKTKSNNLDSGVLLTSPKTNKTNHTKDIESSSSEREKINQWCNKTDIGDEWKDLCMGGFIQHAEELINNGQDVHIVQIGAHVGFENNDPLAKELSSYILHFEKETRQNFHWTFVEPSPPNYKRLMKNIDKYSDICDMQGVNAAIIPDSQNDTTAMTFYSLNETIDPETGYDSKSGKTLPTYITQLSSFSMGPLNYNKRQFGRRGLNMKDYIVESNVTTTGYTDLMKERSIQSPLLVLIDAETFDCQIINGIDRSSPYLPKYLIYETVECEGVSQYETKAYLTSLGYQVKKTKNTQNTVAIYNTVESG